MAGCAALLSKSWAKNRRASSRARPKRAGSLKELSSYGWHACRYSRACKQDLCDVHDCPRLVLLDSVPSQAWQGIAVPNQHTQQPGAVVSLSAYTLKRQRRVLSWNSCGCSTAAIAISTAAIAISNAAIAISKLGGVGVCAHQEESPVVEVEGNDGRHQPESQECHLQPRIQVSSSSSCGGLIRWPACVQYYRDRGVEITECAERRLMWWPHLMASLHPV